MEQQIMKKIQYAIGQTIQASIYGRVYDAKIIAVHDFGTLDVELPTGQCFRITGLPIYESI
jgi:hypothetical protein